MYKVTRRYKGFDKPRREELGEELDRELSPQHGDFGLIAFWVDREGDDLVSVSMYGGEELAQRAAHRRPVHPELRPEASVSKVHGGGAKG